MTLQTIPLLLDINKDLAQYDYVANVQYDDLTFEGKGYFDQVKAHAFDPETFYFEDTQGLCLAGLEGVIHKDVFINDHYNIVDRIYDYGLLREILALKIYVDLKSDFPEVVKELEAQLDVPSRQTYEFFRVYITKNAERYEHLIESTLKNTRDRIEARNSSESNTINDALKAALDNVHQSANAQHTGSKAAVKYSDMKLEDLEEEPLLAPYLASGGKSLAGRIFNSAVGRTFLTVFGAELFTHIVFNSAAAGLSTTFDVSTFFFGITLPFYGIYLLIIIIGHLVMRSLTSDHYGVIKYIIHYVDPKISGTSIYWAKAFDEYCAQNQLTTTPIDKAFAMLHLQQQFEDATMLKMKLEIEQDSFEAQSAAITKFIDANIDVIELRTDAIYERARARMEQEAIVRDIVDKSFNDELKKFKAIPDKAKDDIVL